MRDAIRFLTLRRIRTIEAVFMKKKRLCVICRKEGLTVPHKGAHFKNNFLFFSFEDIIIPVKN
jgi:hypothetical protein